MMILTVNSISFFRNNNILENSFVYKYIVLQIILFKISNSFKFLKEHYLKIWEFLDNTI